MLLWKSSARGFYKYYFLLSQFFGTAYLLIYNVCFLMSELPSTSRDKFLEVGNDKVDGWEHRDNAEDNDLGRIHGSAAAFPVSTISRVIKILLSAPYYQSWNPVKSPYTFIQEKKRLTLLFIQLIFMLTKTQSVGFINIYSENNNVTLIRAYSKCCNTTNTA